MSTVTSKRRWVAIDAISDLTSFSKPAIYRMAREGRIPAHRVGRSVRFDLTEIDTWMAKQPKASS